jgi:hypothetical protein
MPDVLREFLWSLTEAEANEILDWMAATPQVARGSQITDIVYREPIKQVTQVNYPYVPVADPYYSHECVQCWLPKYLCMCPGK